MRKERRVVAERKEWKTVSKDVRIVVRSLEDSQRCRRRSRGTERDRQVSPGTHQGALS